MTRQPPVPAAVPSSSRELIVVPYPWISPGQFLANGILGLLGCVFVLPLIWLIFASVDANSDWAVKIPTLTIKNYQTVTSALGLASFYNSFRLAGITTVLATTLALLAAYPLSRHHVPLKRSFMLAILFLSGLPISLLLVPTYQMYVTFGWLDSFFTTGLFLAVSSLPFAIWLMKNFIDAVPLELEESAAIEGAGTFAIVLRVVMPLAFPGVCVTAIYTFIHAWGAFMAPLILDGNPDHEVGPLAIYHFMGNHGVFEFGQLAAYSFMFSLPVILLYLVMSRHFSGAFTFRGAVK